MNIERAARAERDAEHNRAQADAAWRAAWWETTLALAEPAETDKLGTVAAIDTAQRILGQTRKWIVRRRAAGRHLRNLKVPQIVTLPPRLAVEYVMAGGDPAQAVEVLTRAEADGVSLRDFAASLGTQPTSWQREGERKPTPAQVRDALADPATAREVMGDRDTADAVADAAPAEVSGAIVRRANRQRDEAAPPGSREAKAREGMETRGAVHEVLQRAAELRLAVGKLASLGTLSPAEIEMLAGSGERTLAAVQWLASLAPDQADLGDQVAEFLRGQA